MNGRSKLLRALAHESGPLPVDFGSTTVTGVHCSIVEKLRDICGLEQRRVKVHEPYQMLGMIEEDLVEALGIDVVGISPRGTLFGFPLGEWKEWTTPWNQRVLVPNGFEVDDRQGDIYIYPEGDRSAPPSGHMPKSGYFFDTIIRQPPFDEDLLDPRDNLEEFNPIGEDDLLYFAAEAKRARATGKGVVANFGGTAFGDIALVPAPNLKYPKGIRDIEEWYVSTVIRQDYIHAVFDEQAKIAVDNLTKIYGVVGDAVDVVFICGTDFGTQSSQFLSVDAFNSLYAPYYRRVNDWIHAHTNWKTFKHSCGAVEPLLGPLADCGFDIINPVQCSAVGMESRHLKDTYGEVLTFWGGGVDTQKTLPFGTPNDVRKEVLSRLRVFSEHGGYVFNTIHNLQAETPIENIEAMLEAIQSFRS